MARVASCPQCNCEFVILAEAEADAWGKCPECRAFFQFADAPGREIPALLPIGEESPAADDPPDPSAETVAEAQETLPLDSRITLPGFATETISNLETAVAPEPANVDAGVPAEAEAQADAEDGLAAVSHAARSASAATIEELSSMKTWSGVPEKEAADAQETSQDSADRIDKWFRSKQTLADMPPATVPELPPLCDQAANQNPEDVAAALEDQPVLPESGPTWDDSERMEKLLAGLEGRGHQDLAPRSELPGISTDERAGDESPVSWSPEPATVRPAPVSKPRRSRSVVRTLITMAVAGVIGSVVGYYALLWIAGPQGDFIQLADYLPSAILPAEFGSPIAPLQAGGAPTVAADAPGEVQAGYTAPVETKPVSETSNTENPYGYLDHAGALADRPTDEPAQFDTSAALPLTAENLTSGEAAAVTNAPVFTADELAVALATAQDAQPGLTAGDLSEGSQVQRRKGYSYSLLCDLAQKAAFVDRTSRADYADSLTNKADELFRQTLVDPHTRDEVARIVSKWIEHPKRTHGGVFFAATVASAVDKGTVVECSADVGAGQRLVVLVPQAHAAQLTEQGRPLGIIGWILDGPTTQVNGYTGDAPQAVWASRIIALE